MDEDEFYEQVGLMSDAISDEFRDVLERGFNVGATQKVLSIYVKFSWLFGLCSQPPLAPVDRLIQRAARLPITNWTTIESLTDYREIVSCLKSHADEKGMTLAHWELEHWPSNDG